MKKSKLTENQTFKNLISKLRKMIIDKQNDKIPDCLDCGFNNSRSDG